MKLFVKNVLIWKFFSRIFPSLNFHMIAFGDYGRVIKHYNWIKGPKLIRGCIELLNILIFINNTPIFLFVTKLTPLIVSNKISFLYIWPNPEDLILLCFSTMAASSSSSSDVSSDSSDSHRRRKDRRRHRRNDRDRDSLKVRKKSRSTSKKRRRRQHSSDSSDSSYSDSSRSVDVKFSHGVIRFKTLISFLDRNSWFHILILFVDVRVWFNGIRMKLSLVEVYILI